MYSDDAFSPNMPSLPLRPGETRPEAPPPLSPSEARYRELFENVPDGVYETTEDGRILSANPALVRMLGYASEDELKQQASAESFYVNPAVREENLRTLRTEGRLRNVELELLSRDGRRLIVLENSRAVRDSEGRILCYQGTLADITDLKQAQLALSEARDHALEASRVKSRILANVSHELRTPLNAVLAMAQLLADTNLDAEQRECVTTIQHSSTFLMELISEILDFSRIEAGRLELKPEIFRLRDAVESSAVMVAERAYTKGLELICDISPDVPEMVLSDPARLRQVLTNLVGNAVKFTAAGQVGVSVRPDASNPESTRFEVSDTGIGISEAARASVFEPFHQGDPSTKRRYGGAGLGLSISRQIVEKMGGTLDFESCPGAGSNFWFSIPLAVAPGCRATVVQPSGVLDGQRCLIVSSNPGLSELLAQWCRRWGLYVVEVADPDRSTVPPHDIAVLDRPEFLSAAPAPWISVGARCVLLVPPVLKAKAPAWASATLVKPARELALLQALLRILHPGRELVMNGRARAKEPAHNGFRIIAAEDNPVNQVVIRKLIERLGHRVEVVAGGTEVVSAVSGGAYDLVLMDCQMPGMDGYEATAAIRALPAPCSNVPIVAVTAHAVPGDRESCLESGMNDYLSKPILLDELARVLDRWLGGNGHAALLDCEGLPAIE